MNCPPASILCKERKPASCWPIVPRPPSGELPGTPVNRCWTFSPPTTFACTARMANRFDQPTTRLVELTEDLLDVTRLQAGRLTLFVEPTDLVALVQRVVTRLQMTTDRHTLSVSTEVKHLIAPVDPRRIEQVLSNLIGNAIKYSPEGGPIEISMREDVGVETAFISIRDAGIGIPAHQQTLIFGRFARADNARAYGLGGTGLGLYLCRELIERHGGRIWFESAEGQGSTFFITLPLISYADL